MHPSRLLFPSAGDNPTVKGRERVLAAGTAIHDPCLFPATLLRRSPLLQTRRRIASTAVSSPCTVDVLNVAVCSSANERHSDASHGKPRVGCQLSVLWLHVEMGLANTQMAFLLRAAAVMFEADVQASALRPSLPLLSCEMQEAS